MTAKILYHAVIASAAPAPPAPMPQAQASEAWGLP